MSRRAPRAPTAGAPGRGLGVLVMLLWVLGLGGCAMLDGLVPQAASPAAAAASQSAGTPVVKVEIDAPGPLQDLLERHLDLSRLARLTRGDAVTDTERWWCRSGSRSRVSSGESPCVGTALMRLWSYRMMIGARPDPD